MRLVGEGEGKSSVSFDMWQAASSPKNGNKISHKTQNEMWMGKDRRFI